MSDSETFPDLPHLMRCTEFNNFYVSFLTHYTHIENFFKWQFAKETGLTGPEFHILMGDPRASDCISKLTKLYAHRARHTELAPAVAEAIRQLDELSKLRNRMIHCGCRPGGLGTIELSMAYFQENKDGEGVDHFTLDQLDGARRDLEVIHQFFYAYTSEYAGEYGIRHAESRVAWAQRLGTWLYKSPVQRRRRIKGGHYPLRRGSLHEAF